MSKEFRRWRQGRSVGRTIYMQRVAGDEHSGDMLIGMMDTPMLAALTVIAVNFLSEAQPEIVETTIAEAKKEWTS